MPIINRLGGSHRANINVIDNTVETVIAASGVWSQFLGFDTNGLSFGATPDYTQNHIMATKLGTYHVKFHASYGSTGGADDFEIEIQLNNGATRTKAHSERKLSAGGDLGDVSGFDDVVLNVGDTVELWVRNQDDASNTTIRECQLSIVEWD